MGSNDETIEAAPPPPDPLLGELIGGKFRVLGYLAQGGMARIYRAEQEPLGRIVALKVLRPNTEVNSDPDARFEDRFFLEASTCAKLKHPNTVTLFDFGHHEGTNSFYMVMELVDGRPLSDAIGAEGRIDPVRAIKISVEICRSLQEAHQFGIVHRDLKPSNVMLTDTVEGEAVKVLDFGIAKVLQAESQAITMEDRIVGSPRYMAPEQISQGRVDARTDVYAMGVMLFEMISGLPPYSGNTTIQTLMLHMNAKVPRLAEQPGCEHLAGPLDQLVASCMAKEPSDRPESVAVLRNLLRDCVRHLGGDTQDVRLSTESAVRDIPAWGRALGDEHSQPTLNRPSADTERSFAGRAPLVVGVGGVTLLGMFAGLFLVVGVGLVVVGWNFRETPEVEAVVEEPLPVPPVPVAAPAPPVLTIRSSPEGAEVFEGTQSLGLTPVEIALEPEGPVRQFELRLDGHQPAEVSSEGVDSDWVIEAELVVRPQPGAPVKPPPAPSDPELELFDER